MHFHHMAIFVSDMQEAVRLWRDVLGFKVVVDTTIPDGTGPGPKTFMYPKLLDDIFKVRGARSKMVLLTSDEGALIESQFLPPEGEKNLRNSMGEAHLLYDLRPRLS